MSKWDAEQWAMAGAFAFIFSGFLLPMMIFVWFLLGQTMGLWK